MVSYIIKDSTRNKNSLALIQGNSNLQYYNFVNIFLEILR